MRIQPRYAVGAVLVAVIVLAGIAVVVLTRDDGAAPGPVPAVSGQARFQVITPTLIRMEYAADGRLEDRPTFTVPARPTPVTATTRQENGWLVVQTERLTLRYRENSGPFTADNLTISLDVAGQPAEVRPTFRPPSGTCAYAVRCEAEDAQLRSGASVAYDQDGYTGRGFLADHGKRGAAATLRLTDVPAEGQYLLRARYRQDSRDDKTLSVTANGAPAGQLTFSPEKKWGLAAVPVRLNAGTNAVALTCGPADRCDVQLDNLAVTALDTDYPEAVPRPPRDRGQLGGSLRGLDIYANQAGGDLKDYRMHPGILHTRGWSLLDDTETPLRTDDRWIEARPEPAGAYQDGYFFGYGHDYAQALRDLRTLTGPAVMLPQWAYGVWFSEYRAYDEGDYRRIVDRFARERVPLDVLTVDTDWKSPNQWYGWDWDPDLFPNPPRFLEWAKRQRLAVALNLHGGMTPDDPNFAATQALAGGALQQGAQCFTPGCYRFDWGDRKQAEAWFALHRPKAAEGVRQWWFDWCCTDSVVDVPGITPDSWINELYARESDSATTRGFTLARQGASFTDYRGSYPAGAWGEHRSTVHFTGDTRTDWASLAYAIQLTTAEASVGQPYVSHDIGGYRGGSHLPEDLYARWVQAGTFQPILRLHSHHGDRLPWQYDDAAGPAAEFLRLREALVPYTYSLGWQASQTGLPIARPLYLDYPESADAAVYSRQYLFGPDILVAPVTAPGRVVRQKVWFPPGEWTDYFTRRTYVGPGTESIVTPLDRMPVFVRSGGIIPTLPGSQRVEPNPATLTLQVFHGNRAGQFSLHTDAGEGAGYRDGQFADTVLDYTPQSDSSVVGIGAASGSYPEMRTERAYAVQLANLTAPERVLVDDVELARVDADSTAVGWWHDRSKATLHVRTAPLATTSAHTITQVGGGSR